MEWPPCDSGSLPQPRQIHAAQKTTSFWARIRSTEALFENRYDTLSGLQFFDCRSVARDGIVLIPPSNAICESCLLPASTSVVCGHDLMLEYPALMSEWAMIIMLYLREWLLLWCCSWAVSLPHKMVSFCSTLSLAELESQCQLGYGF